MYVPGGLFCRALLLLTLFPGKEGAGGVHWGVDRDPGSLCIRGDLDAHLGHSLMSEGMQWQTLKSRQLCSCNMHRHCTAANGFECRLVTQP
jgi:hypothetical protein